MCIRDSKYLDIRFRVPYDQVVDLSDGIEWPRWCVGGRLNIADNCVDRWANDPAARDRPAIIWEGEEGTTRTLTYAELAAEVNRCANALRSLGIGLGDAVGLFMPCLLYTSPSPRDRTRSRMPPFA